MNDTVPIDAFALRQEQFLATLGQRRLQIVEHWTELRLINWTRIEVDELREMVSEFAESANDLNHIDLADHARDLLRRLGNVVGDTPPPKDLLGPVTASVERMSLQVDRMLASGLFGKKRSIAEPSPAGKPLAIVAETDAETFQLLHWWLVWQGFAVHRASDLVAARLASGQLAPALVIIDEELLHPGHGLNAFLSTGKGKFGDAPWIVLSRLPDIDLRLRALNAGASACLGKPLTLPELEAAIHLACLPFSTRSLNVQVLADTPERAERHGRALQEQGLTALYGAQLANLPDVLAAHAADVVLLDLNKDPRQRDIWLNLLADTPGFEALPVVCLSQQPPAAACRHRRSTLVDPATSAATLAQQLRQAVLQNDLDTARVLRLADDNRNPDRCTLDVFIHRLNAACSASSDPSVTPVLLVLALDAVLAVLEEQGSGELIAAQHHLETRLQPLLGQFDCFAHWGSCGLLVLLADAPLPDLERRLARLDEAPGRPEHAKAYACTTVALPLNAGVPTARMALAQCQAGLLEARNAGGNRQLICQTSSPETAAQDAAAAAACALPVTRMTLQTRPLEDTGGAPQPLWDSRIVLAAEDGHTQPVSDLFADVVAKGLATQLDVWEMNAAAAELEALPESRRGIEIAMRLSTASRESVMLVPVVRSVVARLPPDRGYRLVFEVAESWLVEQNAAAVEMVEALRGLGCGVMLGDFGGTDNPRNLAWAGWFDYARLSQRRQEQMTDSEAGRLAVEKLLRSASSRGARVIAVAANKKMRAQLNAWGVDLFEPR